MRRQKFENLSFAIARAAISKNWADAINAPAQLQVMLVNASLTGTASDDVGVQRNRAIPRQRPAVQRRAGI